MLYRIHFEPIGGFWCIQFSRPLFGWRSLTVGVQDKENSPLTNQEVVRFDTFDKAEAYVKERGIDKAYDRRASRGLASALSAGGMVPVQVPPGYRLVPESS